MTTKPVLRQPSYGLQCPRFFKEMAGAWHDFQPFLRCQLGKGFAVATHAGWWIIAALGVVILVLGFVTTGAWALQTARRAFDELPGPPRRGAYAGRTPAPVSGEAS